MPKSVLSRMMHLENCLNQFSTAPFHLENCLNQFLCSCQVPHCSPREQTRFGPLVLPRNDPTRFAPTVPPENVRSLGERIFSVASHTVPSGNMCSLRERIFFPSYTSPEERAFPQGTCVPGHKERAFPQGTCVPPGNVRSHRERAFLGNGPTLFPQGTCVPSGNMEVFLRTRGRVGTCVTNI
jgi:hypothetical protein